MKISRASYVGLKNVTSRFFSLNVLSNSIILSTTYQKYQKMLYGAFSRDLHKSGVVQTGDFRKPQYVRFDICLEWY